MPTLTWTYTSAINSAGDPVDWEAFAEIKTNVDLVNASVSGEYNTSTFAGTGGRAITFATAQADTNYTVVVTPSADPGGSLGEVWVGSLTVNGFTVYNSGTATTAFRWKVVR